MDHPEFRVLDLAYAERQLIVVRKDEIVVNGRKSLAESEAAAPVALGAVALASGAAAGLFGRLALPAIAAVVAARSRRREPVIRVLPIRPVEAAALVLPLGHPLFDVVYVGHPARPEVYFPLADFHRRTFEHKFTEAVKLVSSLGASSLRVSALQGWGHDFSTHAKIDFPQAQPLATSAGGGRSNNREFIYTAELPGHHTPAVPDGLVWYPFEEAWQELARQRIEHDLRQFELHVSYTDDFCITTEVAAGAERAGFKIGGRFERQQSTVWAVIGTFPG